MSKRGFEIAKGWEDRDIKLPRRSTVNAAGYDIAAAEDVTVPVFRPGMKPTLIPTGLKAYCQPDEYYIIANRGSGAGKGIVLANGIGVIDADYYNNPTNDGHFSVLIFNVSDHELKIKKGDRIAQVIFQKFLLTDHDETPTLQRRGGFGSTDPVVSPIRIVYDLDDVLWDLTKPTMQRLGLGDKVQTDYHVDENTSYTDEEKSAIIDAYGDAKSFEEIEFYPGAEDILDFMSPEVEVIINSNAYSPDVVAVKRRRLREFYPDMPASSQQINLVTPQSNRKQIDAETLVFMDDSPYNIADSQAKFNLMPLKPWNTTPKARRIATSHDKIFIENWRQQLSGLPSNDKCYVVPVKDLREANDFIRQTIKLKQGELNEQK